MYFKPNLLGGSIGFTVDLSQHTCNCVAAVYLVKMPGKDSNGNTWWDTDGYGYCDAQGQGGGNMCPEVDIMEANKYAFSGTPHHCDAPMSSGYYNSCDGNGLNINDALEIGVGSNDYGPGSGYVINTDNEFNYVVNFIENNGNFSQMSISVVQWQPEGWFNSLWIEKDMGNYGMAQDLRDGLSLVVSNWAAADTEWLSHGRCSGSCDSPPPLAIKDIYIYTGDY